MGTVCSFLDAEQQQHPRKKQQQQQRRQKRQSVAANHSTPSRIKSSLKRDFNLEKSGSRRDMSTFSASALDQSQDVAQQQFQQQRSIPNPLDATSHRSATVAIASTTVHDEVPNANDLSSTVATAVAPPPLVELSSSNAQLQASSDAHAILEARTLHNITVVDAPKSLFCDDDVQPGIMATAEGPSPFVTTTTSASTHRFSISQNSTGTRQTTQRYSVSTVDESQLSDSAHPHRPSYSQGNTAAVSAPAMFTGVMPKVAVVVTTTVLPVAISGSTSTHFGGGLADASMVDPFTASCSANDAAGRSGQELSSLSLTTGQRQRQHFPPQATARIDYTVTEDSPHQSSGNEMMLTVDTLGARPLAVSPLKPLARITTGGANLDEGVGSVVIEELPSFTTGEGAPVVTKAPKPIVAGLGVTPRSGDPATSSSARRDGSPPAADKRSRVRLLTTKRSGPNLFSIADREPRNTNNNNGNVTNAKVALKASFEPKVGSVDPPRSSIAAAFLTSKAESAISTWIDKIDQGTTCPLTDPQLSHKTV